jgi:hypothetical protein
MKKWLMFVFVGLFLVSFVSAGDLFHTYQEDANEVGFEDSYYYANYTIPSGLFEAILKVKHSTFGIYNITVPSGCFNSMKIQFRISSYVDYHSSENYVTCFDGSNWLEIGNHLQSREDCVSECDSVNYCMTRCNLDFATFDTFLINEIDSGKQAISDGNWSTYGVFYDGLKGKGWVSINDTYWGNFKPHSNIYEDAVYWVYVDSSPAEPVNESCTNISDCVDAGICSLTSCVEGSCVYSDVDSLCDDNDSCTVDSCNGGVCVFDTSNCSCLIDSDCPDDGNACTTSGTCSNNTCSYSAVSVDDGNPLTYDSCLTNGTIIHSSFLATNDGDDSGNASGDSGNGDSDPVENETLNNAGGNGTAGAGSASSGTDDESSLWWVWILSGVVLIGLIVGGVFGWKAYQKKKVKPVSNEGVVQQQRSQMMRRPMPPRR